MNSTNASYAFGQLGSGFLDDTGSFVPPAGKVVVAIQFNKDTSFSTLRADSTEKDNTAFIGTNAQVDQNGTNSEVIDTNNVFPKGSVIVGRWTAVAIVSGGECVLYFGK